MAKVFFHSADREIPIRHRTFTKTFLLDLFKIERTRLDSLSFVFCSDNYLLQINKHYLKHSYYTDVISFRLSALGVPVSGEIYLSVDRIKENAKEYKEAYQTELLRVLIHGALHLCGYEDTDPHEKKQMRLKENFYLQLYSKSFT